MAAERFGKYVLLHKIATGGMGEVWVARRAGTAKGERPLAIKRLIPKLAGNPELVKMFLHEARLAARLSHPNICRILELGLEGECHYLALEYLHGESLASVLERSGKRPELLTPPLAAHIVAQALEGLQFAHEATDEQGRPLQLIHGDLSPSNIFVTYDGRVKLLDFGIARTADRFFQPISHGKPAYTAPEVRAGGAVDQRADLYAMGVILWEHLTRRRLQGQPTDPRDLDPAIAPALAEVAQKAFAAAPAERYTTARQMQRDLAASIGGLGGERGTTALAGFMQKLYGQLWIDLRSAALDADAPEPARAS